MVLRILTILNITLITFDVCHLDIQVRTVYYTNNMLNTISARQIQREYKKVLQEANKSKEPIVIMSNNKPLGAVIGLDLLEKLQIEAVLKEAFNEYKAGKTKRISTSEELEAEFEEIRHLSNRE